MSNLGNLKILTESEVIAKIDETLANYAACQDLCEKVMFVLHRFEGRVINVRVKDAIQEALPEWTISIKHSPDSGIRLCLWNRERLIPYSNQFSLTLAKKSETYARVDSCNIPGLNPWYFGTTNSMSSACIELKAVRREVWDIVREWNAALRVLKSISDQVAIFPVSTLFKVGYVSNYGQGREVEKL